MRLESFSFIMNQKQLVHLTSSATNIIKIQKKPPEGTQEAFGIIENYITQNNGKIVSIDTSPVALVVYFTTD